MTILLLSVLLQTAPPNAQCPVMTAEKADLRFSARYGGRTLYFCCERCIREFQESPGRFVQGEALHPARILESPLLFPAGVGLLGGVLLLFRRRRGAWAAGCGALTTALTAAAFTAAVDRLIETRGPFGVNLVSALGLRLYVYALVPGLLVAFLAIREGRMSGMVGALRRHPLISAAAAAAILLPAAWAWSRYRTLIKAARIDDIHHTTFDDYGRPPVPAAPARKALGGVWYRGNDERDAKLFNGGNYRTCTFTLRLESSDGSALGVGSRSSETTLWISLDIERPANTKDGLYVPAIIERCFLTRESDPFMGSGGPIPDRVPLETLKPLWRWRGRYPLARQDTLQGIVYVCEEQSVNAQIFHLGKLDPFHEEGVPRMIMGGARFHYGIQYDLRFRGGVLQDDSALWMGALYRTRKYTRNELPYEQWFSEAPIPVVSSMDRNVVLPESPDREDR